MIVTAPQGNRTSFNAAGGGAYVVFGRRHPRAIDLRTLGRRGFEIRGTGSDWAGFAAAGAGRVNADRLDDSEKVTAGVST